MAFRPVLTGPDHDFATEYLSLTGEAEVASGKVFSQDSVFQHRGFAQILPAAHDSHHAGTTVAFPAAVDDAGVDLVRYFYDPAAGWHRDRYVNIFKSKLSFRHGDALTRG